MDDFRIQLGAELEDNIGTNVQKELDKIKNLHFKISDVKFSEQVNTSIQKQIEAISKSIKPITVPLNTINAKGSITKSNLEEQIFNAKELDKQGRVYFSKIYNTIDKMLPSIKSKFNSLGFDTNTLKVSGLETAKGTIQSFSVAVMDANKQLKTFNFERNKLQVSENGRARNGFVQTDNVKVLNNTNSQLQQTLNFTSKINDRIKDINSKTFNLSKPLISNNNTSLYNEKLSETVKKINEIKSTNEILSDEHKIQIGAMVGDLDRYRKELQNIEYAATKLKPDTFGNAQQQLQATLKTSINEWNKSGLIDGNFRNNVLELQTLLNNATKTEHLDEYRTKLKLISEEFKVLKQENQSLNKIDTFNRKKENSLSKMNSFLIANTNLTKKTRLEVEKLRDSIDSLDDTNALRNIDAQFTNIERKAKATGEVGRKLTDELKNNFHKFSQWVGASAIFFGIQRTIKDMISNVAELDNRLLELSKVSDLSSDGLERITDEAYKLGTTVGKTGTDVLGAITSFKRAGYEISESMDLAKDALKMTNVAEGITDAGVAAENLVHIIKGFGEDTSFSTKILDSVNEVSNTQSVDFDNLIDGAERLSAVANQSGASFDQMLGILTGGYEVLGDMEKVATGSITIFSRLQAIQLEGEETVSTVSKLQDTFNNATNGAVNIVDQTSGQLRNVYDILNDLSGVWGSLDKNTQEALAIEASGIRQKNVFLSILGNWKNVEKAVESASDSFGSADIENQKYLDSLAGRTKAFTSQFEQLSAEIVNSDILKNIVSGGTGTLKVLTEIIDKMGVLGTTITGFAAYKGFKGSGRDKWFSLNSYRNVPLGSLAVMCTSYV